MSGLSSIDGIRRVFKELSDSLEAANDELIETRRQVYTLQAELRHTKDLLRNMDEQYLALDKEADHYRLLLRRNGIQIGGSHE